MVFLHYFKTDKEKLEAFRSHKVDYIVVFNSKNWVKNIIPFADKNKQVVHELLKHHNNLGAQGFFFNLRKPYLRDRLVRQALSLAFDFDYLNENFFFHQYERSSSYFQNSVYEAKDLPTKEEKEIFRTLKTRIQRKKKSTLYQELLTIPMGRLNHYQDKKYQRIWNKTWGKDLAKKITSKPITEELPIDLRLELASYLLKKAGYKFVKGVWKKKRYKLELKFLLANKVLVKIITPYLENLRKLGVVIEPEVVDYATYGKRIAKREFDIIIKKVPQSQYPGTEQRDYWHSATANLDESRNFYGLRNQGVDTLVNKLLYSKTKKEQLLYTRALDRVLYHLHFGVLNWHMETYRIAYWKPLFKPDTLPLYYSPLDVISLFWKQ